MGLTSPMQGEKSIATNPPAPQSGQFVKAQVTQQPSTVVLQAQYAQLSLSTQCDPIWLATLLKGLAA
ncbi:MAG: hypothetical protein CBB95_07705 [Alteromonas sp. TMED35]|nr:MAG: hypothetical protein CBB95_07705 [Alteromonas sp. TMED35]